MLTNESYFKVLREKNNLGDQTRFKLTKQLLLDVCSMSVFTIHSRWVEMSSSDILQMCTILLWLGTKLPFTCVFVFLHKLHEIRPCWDGLQWQQRLISVSLFFLFLLIVTYRIPRITPVSVDPESSSWRISICSYGGQDEAVLQREVI